MADIDDMDIADARGYLRILIADEEERAERTRDLQYEERMARDERYHQEILTELRGIREALENG